MTAWVFTYNGYTWGTSQDIKVVDVAGLDLPELATSDADRPLVDGMFPGVDLARGRVITQTLRLRDKTAATRRTKLAALSAAITRQRTELPLTFEVDGDGISRRIYCRPRRNTLTYDRGSVAVGAPDPRIEFFATDPRIYAEALSSAATGLAVAGTGLTFNALANFSFGGASSGGSVSAPNAGTTPAPWVATITGPVVDPRLQLLATGQQLRMVGSLAVGETLVIDSLARSILLNGTASRYLWLQAGSEWFELAPGANTVTFGATSGSGSLTLTWRSAWLQS